MTFLTKNAAPIAISAGATSVFGWLSVNEIAAICGGVIALVVGSVDIFNKIKSMRRHDKAARETSLALYANELRQKQEHDLRMIALQKEIDDK